MTAQHPADFDHDSRRHEELAPSFGYQSGTGLIVIVVNVRRRDEDAAVDDDHAPSSELRISSTRSDRSWRPLWPLPTKRGTRYVGGDCGAWRLNTSAARFSVDVPRPAASMAKRFATSSEISTRITLTPRFYRPGEGRIATRAAWPLSQPQECETTTGIVNGVGDEVAIRDGGFVECDSGYLSMIATRRPDFAPLDQRVDDRGCDIGVEPNQIGAGRGREVDPPRHTR